MDRVLDVNLRAPLQLAKALLPHMRARGQGHVVAVSSFTALLPSRGIISYASSKAGLSRKWNNLRESGVDPGGGR